MSQIPHHELKKVSKSPIPRSRSDFNYVGLTPKEKRWTTDFSHLLPNFSRDSSGYLRLLESEAPVIHQPKPQNQTVTKLSRSSTIDGNVLNNRNILQPKILNVPPGSEAPTFNNPTQNSLSSSQTSPNQTTSIYNNLIHEPWGEQNVKVFRRSSLAECKITNRNFNSNPFVSPEDNRNRSPLAIPKILNTNPPTENFNRNDGDVTKTLGRCPLVDVTTHRCHTVKQPTVTRSPTLDIKQYSKLNATAIRRSPTLDPKLLNRSPSKRPNIKINRSPTYDSNIFSASPSKTVSRSPTLDPNILNRIPSPGSKITANSSDVVRSQSMRSFRKYGEQSPSKIRNSESAHANVTGSASLRPSTVEETDEEDEEDMRRLRNFSVTPKGVINWGDSFRSHSLTSVPGPDTGSCSGSQWDVTSTRSYSSGGPSWDNKTPERYKVAIMGAEEVGKTSLIRQFQTSEYICAFDTSYDTSSNCAITVILNDEESELEFIDYRSPLDEVEDKQHKDMYSNYNYSIPLADAHVIIYSVTNRRSFLRALDLISKVQVLFQKSAIFLVGNKSDLVRVRAVTTDEGQTSAKEKECTFMETSVAINHQVDELLVSILSEIREKNKILSEGALSTKWNSQYSFSKAKGLIKRFLKKACFQSKSCDNLQRL